MLLKELIREDRRSLITNFINYGIFQASQYIVPLITIPYIIRIVGLEKFGIISLAQGIALYLKVGVDYGWSILGVKYIAQAQKNDSKKSEIIVNIFSTQFILGSFGLFILIILSSIFQEIRSNWIVYFSAFGLIPGNLMTAPWFFVGMEKVKFLNYISFIGRSLYLLLIFSCLKTESQFYLVPIFNSLSFMLSGILSIILIVKKFKVHIKLPTTTSLRRYFREGWPIFLSYFSTNFYRNTNILILGLFASKDIVGIYAAADKIIKVTQSISAPITQTLYPYISRIIKHSQNQAIKAINKLAIIMSIISGLVVMLLIIFAGQIMTIILETHSNLGNQLLQIGSFVILFGVLNYIIGIIYMLNFGMEKQFSKAVVTTGFISIILCFILTYYWSAIGAMITFSIAEFILLMQLLYFCNRNQVNME